MPFDPSLVPLTGQDENVQTFGKRCYAVAPSNTADALDPVTNKYFKYFVARTSGDVAFLGYENLDADTPGAMSVQAGQALPGRIRRIMATGTTATLHGWGD